MLSSSASSTSNKRLSPQPLIKPEKIIPQIKLEEEKVVIDPLKVIDYFGVHKLVTIKDLFELHDREVHVPIGPKASPCKKSKSYGKYIFNRTSIRPV